MTPSSQERHLVEHRDQVDLDKMEAELEAMRESKRRADERLSQLQREHERLGQQAVSRGLLEEHRREKRAKEEALQNG